MLKWKTDKEKPSNTQDSVHCIYDNCDYTFPRSFGRRGVTRLLRLTTGLEGKKSHQATKEMRLTKYENI